MAQLFNTPEQQAQREQDFSAITADTESKYGAEQQARRSFSAGIRNSFLASSLHEVSRFLEHDADPSFNAQALVLQEEEQRKQLGLGLYDPDEREALLSARSTADYAERKGYLAEVKQRNIDIAADPVYGIAGSVLADAPLLLAGLGSGAVAGGAARAAGFAGRAVRNASLVADGTVAAGESALAAFALQQNNPNVTAADLGFAVIGVAGATLHAARTVTKNGKTFVQSSPDAPAVRTAPDIGNYRNTVAPDTALDAELTIRTGEQHVSFTRIEAPEGELKVRVSADAGDGRTRVRAAADGDYFIDAKPSISASGLKASKVSDLLAAVPAEAVTAARTLIKALKSSGAFTAPRQDVLRTLDTAEAARLSTFLQDDKSFLLALQDPSFARTVDALDIQGKEYLDPIIKYHAKADASPNLKSEQLYDLNNDEVVASARTALTDQKLKQNFVEKFFSLGQSVVGRHLSLYDRVAYAGDAARSLANRLFTNGSASGARIDSASDIKRTLQLQGATEFAQVEEALRNLAKLDGVKATDQFIQNEKYSAALYKHADNITRFMQTQYQLERRGDSLLEIPEQYQEAVEAIQNWSRSRRELMQRQGLEVPENFSEWYVPIRYDFAETQAALAAKGIKSDDAIAQLMQQALRDAYPDIPDDIVRNASKAFQDRVEGRGLQAKRTLAEQLDDTGDDLQDALRGYVKPSAGALTQNLRRRTGINTDTKYIVDGKELSFQDLMQKDFVSAMRSYDSHLNGKLALREAGLDTPSALNRAVADAESSVPLKDRAKWKQAIEEGVSTILGTGASPTPTFLSILSKAASATFLRNSGIYQAVDTGFVHMTYGARAIRKAASKETRQLLEGLKDKQVYSQLDAILGGAYQNDTKAAYINRKIEQVINVTNGERALGVAGNFASAAQSLNGMRIVQKAQQGLVGHVMRLQLHNLINASGKDLAAARKVYEEVGGLTKAELDAIRASGDAPLGNALQQRLNNAHSRMLDTVVQQNRTGEIPAWAEYTNAGQILVGFAKFSLVAFNKVLRRLAQERGVLNGIAAAALYTMPWMILAQSVIAVRDGKFFDKEGNPNWEDVLSKSASTLTVWGPGSALADALFGTGKANFGNPGVSWFANALDVPNKVATLDERAGSAIGKAVPFLGMIPGATYMLNEGFSAAAAERDALLEEATN